MRAILDHVGIAVGDLGAALAFFRDVLGLEVEASEDVASQRVRAHFMPAGAGKLELLESTAPDSAIARFVGKRGPGLHHVALRVDDIESALSYLAARGVRLVDERPRPGAEGALVAFIHPASTHGVLVELKQSRQPATGESRLTAVTRYALGDFELISLNDGFFRLDGGAMFGVVPKTLWEKRAPSDDRNRILLSMRPLVVRGARTMIIDAGVGDKEALAGNESFIKRFGIDRTYNLDRSLADAGLTAEDIDIVVATHLHFDHAGGFTVRDASGRIRPRFPRAQYIVRRGEWEDATHANERTRASYLPYNYVPLADAGVLQLVDEDSTIMPGVRVRRTGGHTMHHQMVVIESQGKAAAFVADIMPTTMHVSEPWIMGYDLFPLETLTSKKAFLREAVERDILVFFEHDPAVAAGRVREEQGDWRVEP